MSSIPNLNKVIGRFNQGCSFYQKAINSWKRGELPEYETALRTAATEAIGTLEWALKIYLRHYCREGMLVEDREKLEKPNFHELMELMKKYASPSLMDDDRNQLHDYRDLFRNKGEHDGSIPAGQELCEAIKKIRSIILTYLPIQEEVLLVPSLTLMPDGVIRILKAEYFEMLRSRYEYMDLGGISPRVGSRVVKIRMMDLFVPLRLKEDQVLLEHVYKRTASILASEVVQDNSLTADNSLEIEEETMFDTSGIDIEGQFQTLYRRMNVRSLEIDNLLDNPRVVILGHPGSGKTTVAKYIAYSIATEKDDSIGESSKIPYSSYYKGCGIWSFPKNRFKTILL